MSLYKISPHWKKSILDIETYGEGKIVFETETCWRWGQCFVELTAEQAEELEGTDEFELSAYADEGAYDSLELSDGCSWEMTVVSGELADLIAMMPEEQQELENEGIEDLQGAIEYLYDRDGWDFLEKFEQRDANTIFTGDLVVELQEETE
jgi:hypothetical protein